MTNVGAVVSYRVSPYKGYNCNQFSKLQRINSVFRLQMWAYNHVLHQP